MSSKVKIALICIVAVILIVVAMVAQTLGVFDVSNSEIDKSKTMTFLEETSQSSSSNDNILSRSTTTNKTTRAATTSTSIADIEKPTSSKKDYPTTAKKSTYTNVPDITTISKSTIKAQTQKYDKPYLKAADIVCHAGDTVTMPVWFFNNPGVWGIKFTLDYDNEQFSIISANCGSVFNSSEVLSGPLENKKYVFTSQFTSLDSNNTKNGPLIYLTIKVSDNAKSGKYNFSFCNKDDADLFNVTYKNILTQYYNGSITVR